MRRFHAFFQVKLNKPLNKQASVQRFKTRKWFDVTVMGITTRENGKSYPGSTTCKSHANHHYQLFNMHSVQWYDYVSIVWCKQSCVVDKSYQFIGPWQMRLYILNVIYKDALMINFLSICEIVPRWMPQDLFDDRSTLALMIAWCHQATSYNLNQCQPRSVSPYGVTRSQWVKGSRWNNVQTPNIMWP